MQEVFIPIPPFVEQTYIVVNPNPGETGIIEATFTPDGWIQVPQLAEVFLNGNFINLDSTQLPGFSTNADQTGVSASNSINHPLPTDLHFGLRMRVRQHGSSTDSPGGTCGVVAIDNNLYNNVSHHPEWAGPIGNNAYGVAMVDIQELQAAGCAGITNSLTVLFTASHPNLGSVSVGMIGDGGSFTFALPTPIPETGDWYGATVNGFTLADLPPCAYLVTLTVSLLLTTGIPFLTCSLIKLPSVLARAAAMKAVRYSDGHFVEIRPGRSRDLAGNTPAGARGRSGRSYYSLSFPAWPKPKEWGSFSGRNVLPSLHHECPVRTIKKWH